jgi:hypothetical protein
LEDAVHIVSVHDGILIEAIATQKVCIVERFIDDSLEKLNKTPHNERFIVGLDVEYTTSVKNGGTYNPQRAAVVQLCIGKSARFIRLSIPMDNLKNFVNSFSIQE